MSNDIRSVVIQAKDKDVNPQGQQQYKPRKSYAEPDKNFYPAKGPRSSKIENFDTVDEEEESKLQPILMSQLLICNSNKGRMSLAKYMIKNTAL